MLTAEMVTRMNESMAAFAPALQRLSEALKSFATVGLEIKRRIERDPALLRAWGRLRPKKERRRIGRKIKRLERTLVGT